jgi:hypothetical protein
MFKEGHKEKTILCYRVKQLKWKGGLLAGGYVFYQLIPLAQIKKNL